ncbi:MAG: hypothetical protein HY744_18910 [Deltaproteobacteria bacterium]|nr:hypothetical protein [Deltaproteobacteria bacterium]
MRLPGFSLLSQHYPNGTSGEAKALVGGNANADWITNTCVIRICRALNYAGSPIPGGQAGLTTVRGGDGMRYAFRVSEFKKYMVHAYGDPDIVGGGGSQGKFGGHQGVILFDDCGWSDATGHFDLWDGTNCVHASYWAQAATVKLWETSP